MNPVPDHSLEKYSSAATLSDMEIFVFPELLYSLVLANIMSPAVWRWREDPWFAKLDKLSPYRRVLRLKQFIIDHYEFNLDLDTWGLTDKATEIRRFRPFMDEATVSRSNALFGYEGDRYYFDIDIRRHFGLDKYAGDVIPYWKTETVEAMDAFRFRDGYRTGAGECVSLSTLYAAAMFVVCGIPLDDIFLLATPLHSQNFILAQDGILTNNRRLVTKNMWFNGTELTDKAQRALRHEQVTIVSHHTGHVHCVYPDATIDRDAYEKFRRGLTAFLRTDISMEILANFLRQHSSRQSCFQLMHERHGRPHYIAAEKVYAYEHGSSFKVSDNTRDKLLAEIDLDEFFTEPIEGRVIMNRLDDFFRGRAIDPDDTAEVDRLLTQIGCSNFRARGALEDLLAFVKLQPRLPDETPAGRRWLAPTPLPVRPGMTREEIVASLDSIRGSHPVADLAFYAWRDLSRTDWLPFFKAALERNPVCAKGAEGLPEAEVLARLQALPDESIYDGPRAAQPDEVWNYRRGDGFERALCYTAIRRRRDPSLPVRLEARGREVELAVGGEVTTWASAKNLHGRFEG